MTGTMGITTVPLPAFWSLSKNEADQFRRPRRKLHPCHNPRCAANNMATSTPYKGPPPKRFKRPFNSARPDNVDPIASYGTRAELENSGEIKAHGGQCADCRVPLPRRTTARRLGQSYSRNLRKGSTVTDLPEESTASVSSSSHAPSISTPIRSPPRPSKIGLAPLSVQKDSSSTRSSSTGCSRGSTQCLPTSRLSGSTMYRYLADEQLTPSCLRGGGTAPQNSQRDEEEKTSMVEELDLHRPLCTSALFNSLPAESAWTSHWPAVWQTDGGPIPTPRNVAPNSNSTFSNLSPKRPTCVTATMPPEATTNGIGETPVLCSSLPTVSKSSEGHSGSGFSHGTPTIQHVKISDVSTRSSIIPTTGNATQMCVLEQRLEDEAHKSNSSNFTTLGSDSSKESWSTELSSRISEAKPVSAFYNALYAPECTLSGTKALEMHLQRQRRSTDESLRVALEIAMFSAMITMLVVMFYPAITRELMPYFYGCCPCPAASAVTASRNPSQRYSALESSDGCVYSGGQNLLQCPSAQQTIGSTVVK